MFLKLWQISQWIKTFDVAIAFSHQKAITIIQTLAQGQWMVWFTLLTGTWEPHGDFRPVLTEGEGSGKGFKLT